MNDILELVKHPPSWILAIIVAVVVGHILGKAIRNFGVVGSLEFFVVVVVGALTLHSYVEKPIFDGNPVDSPNAFVVLLVSFTIFSIVLYIVDRRLPKP